MAKQKTVQAEIAIPEAVQEELTLLRGFRDLVAERVAYALGAKVLNGEINQKTAEQRKAFNEASKFLKKNIESFVENGDIEGYRKAVEDKTTKAKVLRQAKKDAGFEKVTKLRKACAHAYMHKFRVYDFLKQWLPEDLADAIFKYAMKDLGVEERFSLQSYAKWKINR